QLWEAKKYGARVALYGRMINHAEHQLTFIEHLRALADGHMPPAEAVRSYHGALARLNIRPYRALEDDLRATLRAVDYGETKATSGVTESARSGPPAEPDFTKMTQAEKVAWNLQRWKRILG